MKTKLFLTGLVLLLLFSACKPEELITFDGTDHIVFRYSIARTDIPWPSIAHRLDSAIVDMTNVLQGDQSSFLFGIAVQIVGSISDVDRPISFKLAPQSTAITGDVELLPSYIRAGNRIDTIWVRFHQTESLREGRQFRAIFELLDNELFNSNFQFARRNAAGEIEYVLGNRFRVDVHSSDDTFPNLWRDLLSLGGNTLHTIVTPVRARCKVVFELMREASGLNEEDFWDFFTYNPMDFPEESTQHPAIQLSAGMNDIFALWGRIMSRMLREARLAGTPIVDEDGVEIRLGSFFNDL